MPTNVLVVVIDGLRASALGAYGNTTFATPAFDRFAAESLLLDWCYAPSADLHEVYRALWFSQVPFQAFDFVNQQHSTGRTTTANTLASLPKLVTQLGYSTALVTDEPLLTSFPGAADFDDVANVSRSVGREVAEPVDDPSNTSLARAFAAASTQIRSSPTPAMRMVWFHSRGMYGPWDAPLAFQRSLLDEGDPPPVESVAPPDFMLKPDDDPDAAFRFACAYAAQTMVLDACWEHLLDAIELVGSDQWLVMLIGARGFPLGEHARIGGVDRRLYADQLHVPWLIRFPDRFGQLTRSQALTSHQDVVSTLIDSLDHDRKIDRSAFDGLSILPLGTAARPAWREGVFATSATVRAIRTAAWCLREDAAPSTRPAPFGESTLPPELFVRPDDRWEANDVAKLCPEVVEELRARMLDHAASIDC